MDDVLSNIYDNIEQRLASAEEWVRGLDRERLGSFAFAEVQSLIVLHAYWIASAQLLHTSHDKDNDYIVQCLTEIRSMLRYDQKDSQETRKELILWWRMSFNDEMMNFVNHSVDAGLIDDLMKVYFNPHYLKYYEAGIWDESHIKRLIHFDIDPTLVTSR